MSSEGKSKRKTNSISLRECLDCSHEAPRAVVPHCEQEHAPVRSGFPPMLLGCESIGERKGDPSEMAGPPVMRRKECYQNPRQTEPRHHNGRLLEEKACGERETPTISDYWYGHSCGDAYVKEKSHG